MVLHVLTSDRLDATFAALADPTRRAILARLATGEASVNELAEPFDISQPAISKHLRVLERAGLISRGQEAQRRPRRLEAKPLAEANEWLEKYRQFWEGNYQRLDSLLKELQNQAKDPQKSVGPQHSRKELQRGIAGKRDSTRQRRRKP
jgi:DNA-binding transcriptional ArsR family regulator